MYSLNIHEKGAPIENNETSIYLICEPYEVSHITAWRLNINCPWSIGPVQSNLHRLHIETSEITL